jgi:hypothetical protein
MESTFSFEDGYITYVAVEAFYSFNSETELASFNAL